MKMMYVAKFAYGKANLSRVEVEKETDKTIVVASDSNLMGWQYFRQRTRKANIHLFQNKEDALSYLVDKGQQYVEGLCRKMESAEQEIAAMEAALTVLDKTKGVNCD